MNQVGRACLEDKNVGLMEGREASGQCVCVRREAGRELGGEYEWEREDSKEG